MRVGGGGSNITRMCLLPHRGHRNFEPRRARTEDDWRLYSRRPKFADRLAAALAFVLSLVRPMDADKVFKALADPTRRKLLDLLCERNNSDLVGVTPRTAKGVRN